jgi:hypothetical protein
VDEKLSKNISKKLSKQMKLPGLATFEIPRNKKLQFPDVSISKEHFLPIISFSSKPIESNFYRTKCE